MAEELKLDELDDVTGGKKHNKKHRQKYSAKCLQCMVERGENGVQLYKYDGYLICSEAHKYQGDVTNYLGKDFEFKKEAFSHSVE